MFLIRRQSSIFTSSASRDSALDPSAENLWLILMFSVGSVIQNNYANLLTEFMHRNNDEMFDFISHLLIFFLSFNMILGEGTMQHLFSADVSLCSNRKKGVQSHPTQE